MPSQGKHAENRAALNYCSQLNQLCNSLPQILNIGMFCYHRVYKDGSEIMMSNHSDWTDFFYKNNLLSVGLVSDMGWDSFHYAIWPNENLVDQLSAVRDISDVHYGISIIYKRKDYFEGYGFGIKKNTDFAVNLLLNNLDQLGKFSQMFSQEASQAIVSCAKDPIRLQTKIPSEFKFLFEKHQEFRTENRLDTPSINYSLFSKREFDCAKRLMLGKTMAQIAEELFLSRRTIETHVENIKNKLGCNKKSELITTLFKSGMAEGLLGEIFGQP